MKDFAVNLDDLLSLAAAVLDESGVLLRASPGFLRLLPEGPTQPVGSRVSGCLIQPPFRELVRFAAATAEGYRGLVTIGDSARSRTLLGRFWCVGAEYRLLAECDVVGLEESNEAILEMHQHSSARQHSMAQATIVLQQHKETYAEAAVTDALTGLGNRRLLDQALGTEINRARRSKGRLCAIMVDMDHFKRVNDLHGHAVGDKLLATLGQLLKSQTRSYDTVARYGGEEFAVLLPGAELHQAASKADQIRLALSKQVIAPLTEAVTASFGVAELAPDESGESLLQRADRALYQAKESGRNCVVSAG